MATKIRALQSLSSSEYGKLKTGETGFCKPSTAKQLVSWGMAEIISENEEGPKKEIKPFFTVGNYESKPESKPVLYKPDEEEDAEKAAGKKEVDEDREKKEQAELAKKKYK
jgi:hypothetical protein